MMKKMAPKKAPMGKMTPQMAQRVRVKADKLMAVKGDKDSAAGAAT